jgi:membrane protease subunit HflK
MTGKKSPWGTSGGNNGGGGGFGGGGQTGGHKPNPDLEDIIKKGHDKFKQTFGPNMSEKRMITLVIAAFLVLWMGSGIYRVNPNELGVVLRFGAFHRITNPGLNYHLPYPAETVIIPSVTSINKVEIGALSRADNPSIRKKRMALSRTSRNLPENLMLAGDRNIVDVDFEVQWKINASRPQDFLFNTADPENSVHSVAKSAMREVIAQHKLKDILTSAQSAIAEDTKELMQKILDDYGAGVEIIAVNLSKPDVPPDVIDEFQDVKRAEQDKETKETKAEGYRNDIIPQARGEAIQMVQKAKAYKARVMAEAAGDASRFNAVYKQYLRGKTVTRERMYLETMEAVLNGAPKVIVSDDNSNFVPFLPLSNPLTKPAGGAQ